MPLSVTCQCGVQLEIDEKFLGKEVLCPDCQRPLPTKAPATPPPLEAPSYRRVSGLAVASLTLALVGAFLIPLPLVAIFFGIVALKQIAKYPNKLTGQRFARAGIVVGGIFTVLTPVAMFAPTPIVLGIDQFMRELVFAGHIKHTNEAAFERDNLKGRIEIKRLDGWALWTDTKLATANRENDVLILVNTAEDAYLACLNNNLELIMDDPDERRKRVLEHFYKSELVTLLGQLRGSSLNREGTVVEKKAGLKGNTQEITLDLRLAGIDRRFLIQYPSTEKFNVHILVGAARRNRFDVLQKDFREMFDTFKELR